jgi:cysteine synthase A
LKIVHSILEMIGHTPLLKLKMQSQSGINIWAKLEYLNPSGSLKDRIALRMIEDAEKNGKLKAGFTIL